MPFSPDRPVLAGERVMHVGEPVALVVAETAAAAQEAGEQVMVDYEPLDPVTDLRAGAAQGAPQLWPEAPGNIGFDWSAPPDPDGKKQAALDRAFAEAAHVVKVELVNQRLVVASLEPRSASASYDAATAALHLALRHAGRRRHARAHVAGVMGVDAGQAACHRRRRRRRLRHEGRHLSGICRAAACRAQRSASRCIGCRRARKPSSATIRAAIYSGTSNLRSTSAAASWRCG